jgi:hypothetical protein
MHVFSMAICVTSILYSVYFIVMNTNVGSAAFGSVNNAQSIYQFAFKQVLSTVIDIVLVQNTKAFLWACNYKFCGTSTKKASEARDIELMASKVKSLEAEAKDFRRSSSKFSGGASSSSSSSDDDDDLEAVAPSAQSTVRHGSGLFNTADVDDFALSTTSRLPGLNNPGLNTHESAAGATEKLCVVCMDCAADHMAVPCGHKVACKACFTRSGGRCPFCREEIGQVVRVYDVGIEQGPSHHLLDLDVVGDHGSNTHLHTAPASALAPAAQWKKARSVVLSAVRLGDRGQSRDLWARKGSIHEAKLLLGQMDELIEDLQSGPAGAGADDETWTALETDDGDKYYQSSISSTAAVWADDLPEGAVIIEQAAVEEDLDDSLPDPPSM